MERYTGELASHDENNPQSSEEVTEPEMELGHQAETTTVQEIDYLQQKEGTVWMELRAIYLFIYLFICIHYSAHYVIVSVNKKGPVFCFYCVVVCWKIHETSFANLL